MEVKIGIFYLKIESGRALLEGGSSGPSLGSTENHVTGNNVKNWLVSSDTCMDCTYLLPASLLNTAPPWDTKHT